MNGFFVTMLKK